MVCQMPILARIFRWLPLGSTDGAHGCGTVRGSCVVASLQPGARFGAEDVHVHGTCRGGHVIGDGGAGPRWRRKWDDVDI